MTENYKVLARKYRPTTFDDLIGQEALVQTLSNAIQSNRLAQAYILTGIRGTGKTTSARLIAKALNCIGPDGNGGMTTHPCGVCKHCQDIANDCHLDVIEIDAASNTGVDNIREIIEGAKYNPLSARYKIYIIDEVHMLSKQAFNALLKTLEEPPERVKFIFATTEIGKVPVTVLSRCQRFDLKRVAPDVLETFFKKILEKENFTAEDEALKIICQSADGSVRDGLSLLDQALAHCEGKITTSAIRKMIGVSNKNALFNLFEGLLAGDAEKVLTLFSQSYLEGADPKTLIQDLLFLVNFVTKVKVAPKLAEDFSLSQEERHRAEEIAKTVPLSQLSQIWQMLMKGSQEMFGAFSPYKTTEMLFIRICYASSLPPLESILSDLKKKELTPVHNPSERSLSSAKKEAPAPLVQKQDVKDVQKKEKQEEKPAAPSPDLNQNTLVVSKVSDIVKRAKEKGEHLLAYHVGSVSVEQLENGKFIFSSAKELDKSFQPKLKAFLEKETNTLWEIEQKEGIQNAPPSLKEQKKAFQSSIRKRLSSSPV
ncbi:MAG: DNA polymerase III subunit gamma/tau, partial [Alphaproteobacteria bacterium]|nr:DNA polymerase III subunit gamma/tau [Alphaproteobacteria bacterium]